MQRLGWLAAGLAAAAATGVQAGPPAHPDLSGLWSTASLTELERPDAFKTLVATETEAAAYEKAHRGKPPEIPAQGNDVGAADSEWWENDVGLARIRGQVRTSWIVAPADGKVPANAAAKAAGKANRERRMAGRFDGPEALNPNERCLGTGAAPPLENGGYNDNFMLVQTPGALAIYAEWNHDVRVVRIGAAHPPKSVRVRGGDSVGRWEGQELVVETTNFAPDDVRAPDGDPAADMTVTERFSRTGAGELTYSYRVSNPARFTQSWAAEMPLHATKGPIYEYACHEGNYALPNILAGARAMERAGGTTAAK